MTGPAKDWLEAAPISDMEGMAYLKPSPLGLVLLLLADLVCILFGSLAGTGNFVELLARLSVGRWGLSHYEGCVMFCL